MSYQKWFFSLESEEQDAYAEESGTNGNYLRLHVFCSIGRRKIPRKKTIERLADNAPSEISLSDVLDFLYKQEIEKVPLSEAG